MTYYQNHNIVINSLKIDYFSHTKENSTGGNQMLTTNQIAGILENPNISPRDKEILLLIGTLLHHVVKLHTHLMEEFRELFELLYKQEILNDFHEMCTAYKNGKDRELTSLLNIVHNQIVTSQPKNKKRIEELFNLLKEPCTLCYLHIVFIKYDTDNHSIDKIEKVQTLVENLKNHIIGLQPEKKQEITALFELLNTPEIFIQIHCICVAYKAEKDKELLDLIKKLLYHVVALHTGREEEFRNLFDLLNKRLILDQLHYLCKHYKGGKVG